MTAPDPLVENPLVSASAPTSSPSALPAFDRLRPEHASPAVDAVLAQNRARLEALVAGADDERRTIDWERLIEPIEDMEDHVARAWGPVSHLFGVMSTAEWRKAYN